MDRNKMNPREWLGKQIREYKFTDIMGSGGMSAVFRATHVKLQVERAVKVLRPDLASDSQFVKRFEQEARILAVLEHPHLIRVFEFFEEKGFLFIVMEIVPGDSLDDLALYHGVIPAREMWIIVSQAAQGLSYAHNKGIVHRDLSPDNLMISGYDEQSIKVKVIDFGIARQDAFDSESRKIMETGVTSTGTFIGKLRYCSPEQAMELPVDHRSDQYSLALIFLEIVSGRPAFEGNSPITMLMRRVKEAPPRLADLVTGSSWPTDVDRVLERAMQSSPTERYPSIIEFAEALGEALGLDEQEARGGDLDWGQNKTGKKLIEPEDEFLPDYEADELILGLTSLAESMDKKPDRTIYSDRPDKQPQYGRVQAPAPKKPFPWLLSLFILVCLGLAATYFVLPDEKINLLKNKITQFTDKSVAKVDKLMASDPTPTPEKTKKKNPVTRRKIINGPYGTERPGVKPPVILKSSELKIPSHLKQKYTSPLKVVVQCVVLKNGKVFRAEVRNSLDPDLDKMATEAVKTWKFKNGFYKGKPEDIFMDVVVVFR